jgi:hypothetical protein
MGGIGSRRGSVGAGLKGCRGNRPPWRPEERQTARESARNPDWRMTNDSSIGGDGRAKVVFTNEQTIGLLGVGR